MIKLNKLALVIVASAVASGCADQDIKPATVLCPLLGSVLGAGIVAGGLGGDDAGPMAAGAAIGAAAGYFLCVDRAEQPKKPAPAPAPRPAAPAPAPKPMAPPPPPAPEAGTKIMSLEGANFDFDKATLRPDASVKLDQAAAVMTEHSGIAVNVEGHTDNVGSDTYNQGLSERRAKSVVDYLLGKGIDGGRLNAAGYGESRPAASNDTEEGRAQNRRVDLIVAE